ncbi:major histocompatibility complex class I-related gene protein-like [Hemicordylus capensis]|uniref:major histocompatibility complex class I-related gene protein-like n=1 Tax=Hemicordylus capensis TaxID=884348 RepID=UPI002303C04B|nr:major histocompatibility complex class I-related gene protein-like [Hemicordylus capensis]
MGRAWWHILFLGVAAFFLRGGCHGSSLHSLRHFYLGVSEPIQGLPWFTLMGYMDEQLISRYDSNTRRDQAQVSWMEKAEDAWYWKQETQHAQEAEDFFKVALATLETRYKQSGGLHTWQCLVGCELSKDRKQKGRFMQCGYDGRDFISLDKETFTWTAADEQAQMTKWKWEADPSIARHWNPYLESKCFERLQKYLVYMKETLLRTETPTVKVTRKVGLDGIETLLCRAYGFYPKEIDATWKKDGEIWEQETLRGGVTPNLDGTFYTWLSTELDPKEKDHYQCHVEHDGLLEPLVLGWEDPASVSMGVILGVVVAVGLLVVAVIIFFINKRQRIRRTHGATYQTVPKEQQRGAYQGARSTQEAASSVGLQEQEEGTSSSSSLGLADHPSNNCDGVHLPVNREDLYRANPSMGHGEVADSSGACGEMAGGIPATASPVLSHCPQIVPFPFSSSIGFHEEEEEEEEEETGKCISWPSSSDSPSSRPLLPLHSDEVMGGQRAPRCQARRPGKWLSLQLLLVRGRLWRDPASMDTAEYL